MLNFLSFNLILFAPCALLFIITWYSYFLVNNPALSSTISLKDSIKVKNKNIVFNILPIFNFNFILPVCLYIVIYFYFFKGSEGFYFFRHLFISNFVFSLFFYTFLLSTVLYFVLTKALSISSYNNVSLDYIVSIIHILFFLPYMFFSSNMLVIFFFLELASNLVLYNLLSSSNWFSLNSLKNKKFSSSISVSKYFFNTIFFHFWSSFFSSILIVYSIISFYLYFGTTEWFYINFLLGLTLNGTYALNSLFLYLNLAIFFIAFTIKLGISPFFVYKLEVYKGLPLYNIFFYSSVFFIFFFTTFFLVCYYYLFLLFIYLKFFVLFLILLSITFVILFMFDSLALRNFFAFSSLINSVNLLILLV